MDTPMAKAPKKKAVKKCEEAEKWKDIAKNIEVKRMYEARTNREEIAIMFKGQMKVNNLFLDTLKSLMTRITVMTLLFPVTWIMLIVFVGL